jgi:hypothetical protein
MQATGPAREPARVRWSLSFNPCKENLSGVGRPIKIVDGGQPVKKVF